MIKRKTIKDMFQYQFPVFFAIDYGATSPSATMEYDVNIGFVYSLVKIALRCTIEKNFSMMSEGLSTLQNKNINIYIMFHFAETGNWNTFPAFHEPQSIKSNCYEYDLED